eukprot:c8905_g1_i1.p1 GENE.c8905_g1_i1~~c8905_g1_i1.p1  ORF type:complete len:1648 (+),score=296.97 c8905_g1_i1:90-4946(+)
MAVDAAGNPERTPHTISWSVNTELPALLLDSLTNIQDGSSTSRTSAFFSFSTDSPLTTFECKIDGNQFSACAPPVNFTNLENGPHVFSVRLIPRHGDPSVPITRSWTIDTTPSITRFLDESSITDGGSTNKNAATFYFVAQGAQNFQCALDGADFKVCRSPVVLDSLAEGDHFFHVRSINPNGVVEKGTQISWTIDTIPPTSHISSLSTVADGSSTKSRSAKLFFASSDHHAHFECSFDSTEFAACTSPMSIDSLVDGHHTFSVRSVDLLGNVEPHPQSLSWTVDTTPPTSVILPETTAKQGLPTTLKNHKFFFSSDDSTATFQCSLDGAPFQLCSSPKIFQNLDLGSHIFRVKAADALGNIEAVPQTRNWFIEAIPTSVEIDTQRTTVVEGQRVRSKTATIFFVGQADTPFECALDQMVDFEPCSSPQTFTELSGGDHVFFVRPVGSQDQKTTITWTVDTSPVSVSFGPGTTVEDGATTSSTKATIHFKSNDPARFECRIDSGEFVKCASPLQVSKLALGPHKVDVRIAGSTSPASMASLEWIVTNLFDVTLSPKSSVIDGTVTTNSSATFSFVSATSKKQFSCKLDTGGFEHCPNPFILTNLSDGVHTLLVRTFDLSRTNEVPLTVTWIIDSTPPVSIFEDTSSVSAGLETTATNAILAFHSSDQGARIECSVDGGPFVACVSPIRLTDLAVGHHTLSIRSTDLLGNVETPPVTRQWTVITPPDTDSTRRSACADLRFQLLSPLRLTACQNLLDGSNVLDFSCEVECFATYMSAYAALFNAECLPRSALNPDAHRAEVCEHRLTPGTPSIIVDAAPVPPPQTVVSTELTISMNDISPEQFSDTYGLRFVRVVADQLRVNPSRVKILGVRRGSVIVSFSVTSTSSHAPTSSVQFVTAILKSLNFTKAIRTSFKEVNASVVDFNVSVGSVTSEVHSFCTTQMANVTRACAGGCGANGNLSVVCCSSIFRIASNCANETLCDQPLLDIFDSRCVARQPPSPPRNRTSYIPITIVDLPRDEHGCLTSYNYTWCETLNECVQNYQGGDKGPCPPVPIDDDSGIPPIDIDDEGGQTNNNNNNTNVPRARCGHNCFGHGRCVENGVCACQRGFTGEFCHIECPARCSGRGTCQRLGNVGAVCKCEAGWTGELCDETITTDCKGDFGPCNGAGTCSDGKCTCALGYSGDACEISEFRECPSACRDNGQSCTDGVCECAPGFNGTECSEVIGCAALQFCSGHGQCRSETETCTCDFGWGGQMCEKELPCKDSCSGQGICSGFPDFSCECFDSFQGASCNSTSIDVQCAHGCSGAGVCSTSTKRCSCNHGFSGHDCSFVEMPAVCSRCVHGKCIFGPSPRCQCDEGWGGFLCSELLACQHLAYCSGRGTCKNNACECFKGYSGESCQIQEQVLCPSNCGGNGICLYDYSLNSLGAVQLVAVCQCSPGFTGPDCAASQCMLGENGLVCSGHGVCESDGAEFLCTCDGGYEGIDCNTLHQPCPGSPACSDHGTCDEGLCLCDEGFTGLDCALTISTTPSEVQATATQGAGSTDTQAQTPLAKTSQPQQQQSQQEQKQQSGTSEKECCPKNCSDNGVCDSVLCKCVCGADWTGAACDVFSVEVESGELV